MKVKKPKKVNPVQPLDQERIREAELETRRRFNTSGRSRTTFAGRQYGASRGVMGDAVAAMSAVPRVAGGY